MPDEEETRRSRIGRMLVSRRDNQRRPDSPDKVDRNGRDDNGRSKRNGFVNGLSGVRRRNGITNGLTNGLINGQTRRRRNGLVNGLTNGLVNGSIRRRNGLVNGLTNGLVNGAGRLRNGLVNGLDRKTGLVNGNGFINGFRLSGGKRGLPLTRKKTSLRVATIVAMVAIIIVIPFLLISSMPESTIKIDGYFFDWERAGYLHETEMTAEPEIDIREYSVVVWQNTVYCYVSTAEPLFDQEWGEPAAVFAMIDVDNNLSTGYAVEGIGADIMVEILGWNSTAKTSTVSTFIDSYDKNDFGGFAITQSAMTMGVSNQWEFSFRAPSANNATVKFLSKNHIGLEDFSRFSVRFDQPALKITTDLNMTEVISPDVTEQVMTLRAEAQRGDAKITALEFEKHGNASDFRLFLYDRSGLIAQSTEENLYISPALEIKEGYGKDLFLFVQMSANEEFSSFGLSLNPDGVILEKGTAAVSEIQSLAKVAYVGSVPERIVIDGAFADWTNGYVMMDAPDDVLLGNGTVINDPSIDIREYGMYVDDDDIAMYLAVADRLCNGTMLPINIEMPVPTTGLPDLEAPELIGADIAGVLIDADLDMATGVNLNDIIGAEFLVFIAGKKGEVLNSDLYSWDAAEEEWQFMDLVRYATDWSRLEFAFDAAHIPLNDTDLAAVGFFMTDWKGGTDYSDSLLPLAKLQGDWFSRAFGGILINEVYNDRLNTNDWIELYNTGTQPISLDGWIIYDKYNQIYVFGDVVLNPGELLVITDIVLDRHASIVLVDDQGMIVDAVKVAENNNGDSWSRTGPPPYNKWKWLDPTPGSLNPGQVPIPEFSDIVMPLLAITGICLLFARRKRGRKKNETPR